MDMVTAMDPHSRLTSQRMTGHGDERERWASHQCVFTSIR